MPYEQTRGYSGKKKSLSHSSSFVVYTDVYISLPYIYILVISEVIIALI